MMHNNNFVVSVKSAGKVLREFGDTVYLPFGSEFSVYLKNLNSKRAKVKVSIDGTDVLNGGELVVEPNSHIELERYLRELDRGNRFRFIERTGDIEEYRGIKAEDGLIRIEFAYERQYHIPTNLFRPREDMWMNATHDTHFYGATSQPVSMNATYSSVSASRAVNDVGITVPGSVSTQKFTEVSYFATDPSSVLVLKLVGETEDNKVVSIPVTVKQKAQCRTCGRLNKATSNFCTNCGTSLEII
jgi:hypothetical protein